MQIANDTGGDVPTLTGEETSMAEYFDEEDAYMKEHGNAFGSSIRIMNEAMNSNGLSRLSNCSKLETITEEQDSNLEQDSVSPIPNTDLPTQHNKNPVYTDKSSQFSKERGFIALTKDKHISQESIASSHVVLSRLSAPVQSHSLRTSSLLSSSKDETNRFSSHGISSIPSPKKQSPIKKINSETPLGPRKPSSVMFPSHNRTSLSTSGYTGRQSNTPLNQRTSDYSKTNRLSGTLHPETTQSVQNATGVNRLPQPSTPFRPFEPRKSMPTVLQRQSMPVSRLSSSSDIKPRSSIATRKSDIIINERKEENSQRRVEELSRENARLRNELNKANEQLRNADIRIKMLERELKQRNSVRTRV